MAKAKSDKGLSSPKKKTNQGLGKHTRKTRSGGETFHNGVRAGTPPSARHRRRKPYKGQGKK